MRKYIYILLTSCIFLVVTLKLYSQNSSISFPEKDWEAVSNTGPCNYFNSLRTFVRDSMNTTGLMIIKNGKVALSFGDIEELSYIASARKSIVSMLYGKYLYNGRINISSTLKDLNVNDIQKLLPIEESASIRDLLTSRSGVYHPASNEGSDPTIPKRGTKQPGTHFVYNNWDFNVAGAILEQSTNQSIYDLFMNDLAIPLEMQDYYISKQKKFGDLTISIYPASHFFLSTRDMARIGYLMLRNGNWNGKQLIPESWIKTSTTPVSTAKVQNSIFDQYGYMWWLAGDSADSLLKGSYTAIGAYGQFITVIPKLDMVIAHKTKATYERHSSNYEQLLLMIVAEEKNKSKSIPDKSSYIGTYHFQNGNDTIEFKLKIVNDELLLKGDENFPFEFELSLCSASTGVFIFKQMNNEMNTINFEVDSQNEVLGFTFMGDRFIRKK